MNLARRPASLWLADALVVAAIAAWAFGARSLPEFVLPGPLAVAERLWVLFTDLEFLSHTVASTVRVLASVLIALLLGELERDAFHWALLGSEPVTSIAT